VASSVGRHATSPRKITGCALAIVGAVFALAGGLAHSVGLALVASLYAVGVLVASARRRVEVAAGVNAREVQRSVRDVQRRAVPPLPREIRFKIKRLTTTISELLPRADGLGVGSSDLYLLVQCATDYLPTAFQAYLDLPRDYAERRVVANGKTPLALLSEQLDVLTTQIDQVADRVNGFHSDKLIASGRFLGQKFGRGPLDLDAGSVGAD
jgi:hypothetical protein